MSLHHAIVRIDNSHAVPEQDEKQQDAFTDDGAPTPQDPAGEPSDAPAPAAVDKAAPGRTTLKLKFPGLTRRRSQA